MTVNRREFLKGLAGAAGAASLLAASGCSTLLPVERRSESAPAVHTPGRPFSFVHLTDQHVRRKRRGDLGYARCIESVKALRPRPAFVLMGGDLAFDGNYNEKDEFIDQILLYKDISDDLGLPYFHCMGNHDTLGLHPRRKVPTDDPDLGKKLIMDILGWESSYYSFDFRGWHFSVLDSILPVNDPEKGPIYRPELGDEQRDWLAADLGRAAGRPTVAMTHIAMFCNIGQLNGDMTRRAMDGAMVINDTREVRRILERHNVRAVLQGHSHDVQEFFYNGITYITTQAASGAWWSGNWHGFEPGYTVFHVDGDSLQWERREFEWAPRLEPEDTLEREKLAEREAELAAQKERRAADEAAGAAMTPRPLPRLIVGLGV
ncbi:MAG: hypothetical protein Kow0059_19880 [Candidatus Sumerlaeia bacterium]